MPPAVRVPARPILTFDPRQPQIWGYTEDNSPVDVDVAIAFHACRGAGDRRYQAPDRGVLYAINGRPC